MRLFLLVALTMVAFAANSILNRMALAGGEIGPALFAAIRLGSGAAVLAAIGLARGRRFDMGGGRRLWDAAALAVYMLGFAYAYLWLDAGLGALILFGTVQVTMFAGALAQGDRLPLRRWIGAALAFGGLVWLLWPKGAEAPPPAGAALMALAGIGWGIYSLRGRGAGDPQTQTAINFLLATPAALVVLAIAGLGQASLWGVVLAVTSGVVTSGLGYSLWYAVLPRLEASVAAVAQLTVPVIAIFGGAALLAETPGLRVFAGAGLVVGGVGLSLLRRRVVKAS